MPMPPIVKFNDLTAEERVAVMALLKAARRTSQANVKKAA